MKRPLAIVALPLVIVAWIAVAQQPDPRLDSDEVNLSSGKFLAAFASKDPEERERARMYMLGVFDSTEGRGWCDYKQLKTVTLQEFAFEALKKSAPRSRASTVIEQELARRFACKGAK